jgi:hypothetical protein
VVNLIILHKGKNKMALTSPGVEVTITDQSQYLPAPTNSVPLVVLATAQNKADASGTGVAAATTAANAGKLYQVTSQRDLVNLYGTPFFYTTTNGTPIQGYELNEYGLLAAYSLLGVTNRCYVLRADIDLASLVGQTGRPTGAPDDGTYWLDTTTSTWGIYEFNATTGQFSLQSPIVITDSDLMSGGAPLASVGSIGDYAVNAIPVTGAPTASTSKEYFYKTSNNAWTNLGSNDWLSDWPTVQGTNAPTSLTAGNTFTIEVNGQFTFTVTVPAASNNTVAGVAAVINDLGYEYIRADVVSGKLTIYSMQPPPGTADYINIGSGTGSVLSDLGITVGNYFQPSLAYGTSAQMPLWTSSQSQPRPTGSVWIKVGASGNGLDLAVSQYSTATASWRAKNVTLATSDWSMDSTLDATGGQLIPAGSVYGQYNYNGEYNQGPVYLFERIATGPTVITGTETDVTFDLTATVSLVVQTSIPGSTSLSSAYLVTIEDGDTFTDFVTAWSAAGILYTTCSVTTDGALQITHTEGGEIVISDFYYSGASKGTSSGALAQAGLVANTTDGCKYGPSISLTWSVEGTTDGSGDDLAVISVTSNYGFYELNGDGVTSGGSGYAVGDTITISGADLGGTTPANDLVVVVNTVSAGAVTSVTTVSGVANIDYSTQLSNWYPLTYTANEGAPVVAPANNTNWFWSVTDQVDIMVNTSSGWVGYKNTNYDTNGFPTPSGSNATDPAGPIISASEPTTQSDGTALVYGDLWINTTNLEDYPVINRWQLVEGVAQWVVIDNADQTSSEGVVFADARWATSGNVNPADDPIPTIASLLSSDYLDLDAPSSSLYPVGMLLFNTRRSGYNVKQYRVNYFNSASFPDESLPSQTDAWVSVSGLQSNGSPYMGRKAQRAVVVEALRSVIDTNTDIRDEDNFFNLMATPNYPELQPNMVVLNNDRGETGYIIGDTPMGLADSATDIQAWATNAAGATSTGEEGCVTRNTYLGLFYPSGIAPDLSGNLVAVPASHMMLRTFLRNDTISYPWLAAAGTRRGTIDNATNIGYLNRQTGEFITIKTRLGIRDVLYVNFINPLVFFTGVGLLNYGNKTSFNSSSALDRTNVARLIAYIRRQLTLAARPFVFEPNDALTRQQISGVVESLMVDLVAKRGLYDYLVVCDDSNNTPARIDRNELWIDVAVEPVKAAEFIYIPVRVLNTGELSQ